MKWKFDLKKNVSFIFPVFLILSFFFLLSPPVCFQGLDEEAIVDHGKTSFTTHTNYEKEDLESKFKATQSELSILWQCAF